MATEVSEQVQYLADQWENHCGYSSAVLSGIRPDPRHLDNGGFHCSIEDLIRFGNQKDFSNTRPDDKGFNPRYGAAVDVSMSPTDMKRCHDRVRRVWADKTDPRRKYLNCINTWDGSGDAVRLDFYAGTARYASPDHKWHNHGEVRRRYLLDMTAAKAIVSALKGESKATYLASIGQGEDDMSEADIIAALRKGVTSDPVIREALRRAPWEFLPADHGGKTTAHAIVLNGLPAQLAALAGRDFTDEPAIIQGVLAGLPAEKIAAAIPPEMAKQVAEELARRIAE